MKSYGDNVSLLFPACAGVILSDDICLENKLSFPRMCGGDPAFGVVSEQVKIFSPHVRG